MFDSVADNVGKIGMQRSTQSHIQNLNAAADCEHRKLLTDRLQNQRGLITIAFLVYHIDRFVRLATIQCRIQIASSRQDQTIAPVDPVLRFQPAVRDQCGNAVGPLYRLYVFGREMELILLVSGVGSDSYQRWCHMRSKYLFLSLP